MSEQLGIEVESFVNPSTAAYGITGEHIYIVYTDSSDNRYVLEGGLYEDPVNIDIRTGPLEISSDPGSIQREDGTIVKNESFESTYIQLDIPANQVSMIWQNMLSYAQQIEDAQIPYVFSPGPNSNSVAAAILNNAGFDAISLLGLKLPADVTDANSISYVGSGLTDLYSLGFMGAQNTQIIDAVPAIEYTYTGSSANEQFVNALNVSNIFNGNDGLDDLSCAGNASDFTISRTDSETRLSTQGIDDLLSGVERLHFDDKSVALDIDDTAGKAYRLYQAAFDRIPDLEGLGYWIESMDNGTSLQSVASSFLVSAEFQSMYGTDPSDSTFVTLLYNNILNRTPDDAGMAYWLDELSQYPTSHRAEVLASFSESAENQTNVETLIANGIEYIVWDG